MPGKEKPSDWELSFNAVDQEPVKAKPLRGPKIRWITSGNQKILSKYQEGKSESVTVKTLSERPKRAGLLKRSVLWNKGKYRTLQSRLRTYLKLKKIEDHEDFLLESVETWKQNPRYIDAGGSLDVEYVHPYH